MPGCARCGSLGSIELPFREPRSPRSHASTPPENFAPEVRATLAVMLLAMHDCLGILAQVQACCGAGAQQLARVQAAGLQLGTSQCLSSCRKSIHKANCDDSQR